MQNGASGRRVQGFDSWERGGGGGFTDCAHRSAPQCVLDTGLCISTWFRSSYTRRSNWRTSRQAASLNFQVVWLWMNELYLFSWINNRSKLTPCKRKLQWVWAQLSFTLLTRSWRSKVTKKKQYKNIIRKCWIKSLKRSPCFITHYLTLDWFLA